MPNRRLSMRKIKEVLRLKYDCGISEREIARSCQVSRSTVADYLRRAAAAKLSWSEASSLAQTQLEERLFPTEHIPSTVKRPAPDCEYIYNELRTYRKFNLTLSQLWLEYKQSHPDGYQYTQFCEHYWRWRGKLDYVMRQEHRGGEKLFIDYSDGLSIVDMAEHYGCAVLPARPRKPRDKAKVENGVLVAQRWILAVLRHRTFYSLAELNAAISECLERLNNRPMRKLNKSRRELFEAIDRPNALPLPQRSYEYAEWSKAKVQLNYHIEVDRHYYSVPYQLLHERLGIRLTATIVEAFHKGERVAAHVRSLVKGGYATLPEHMPPSHRYYAEWNPSRFIQWAGKTGEATARLVETILSTRPYPEQGYKACLGIINLTRDYEPPRVEAAARWALEFKACSYRSMKAILSAGLERHDNGAQPAIPGLLPHQNIRGQEYYQ